MWDLGSADALTEAFDRYRVEIADLLESDAPDLLDEFIRLHPPLSERAPMSKSLIQTGLHAQQAKAASAGAALVQLSGWLNGLVEEQKMAMEAQAYAEARIKAERPTGFQPPS